MITPSRREISSRLNVPPEKFPVHVRLRALRSQFVQARLDALLVTFPPHVRYLTGFSGSNGLCLITKTGQTFVSDGRYRVQAREEVQGFRILFATGSLLEVIARRHLLPPKASVGYDEQHATVAELKNLKKLFPRAHFVAASGMVDRLAAVKDEGELGLIRHAVKITDAVFMKVVEMLKPGMSELDIAAEISYLHRSHGAEGDAFEPIVASGTRGAMPHARASRKKIKMGELVTIDMGCRYGGYHSDLTRTLAVGKPNARARNMYQVVADAQRLALDAAASGIGGRTLDAIARSFIKKKGYGKYFSHSLGHGLGLQVHELPRLSQLSTDTLAAGNVVTVEPGVYIPGFGGVRIEDDVVIRERSAEVLNTAPKELIVV